MLKTYSVVFIDWDDTLWDFHANAYIAMEKAYDKYDLQRYFHSFQHFYNLYEGRNRELWAEYAQGNITKDNLQRERFQYPFRMVNQEDDDLAGQVGNDFLELTIQQNKLITGAKELMAYLAQKYPIIVLSNGFKEVQYRKIATSGLQEYITHVVLSEEVGVQKPNKLIFEYALKLINKKASEVMMIGDNMETDIMGAAEIGMDTIYLSKNMTSTTDYPTYTVQTLREIQNIL
ncbi:MAG: YjjG family noncanonical pyrimidine nucleotidase [Paludibacteraceae bacterium]|nr:YjjG family noncanonical pyrimidine nucleotidase [Paludibacteraceae bacterium]